MFRGENFSINVRQHGVALGQLADKMENSFLRGGVKNARFKALENLFLSALKMPLSAYSLLCNDVNFLTRAGHNRC